MELHIRDVSKTYSNGVQALKDVTLTVRVREGPGPTFLSGYRLSGVEVIV